MKKYFDVKIALLILILFSVRNCFSNSLVANIDIPQTIIDAEGIKVISNYEDGLSDAVFFMDIPQTTSLKNISFISGQILLKIDYELVKKTLTELEYANKNILVFATSHEKKKGELFQREMQQREMSVDLIVEDDQIAFIRNFRERSEKYDVIILFQDSMLYSKNNQRLLATLMFSVKKMIVTFGISGTGIGVLHFTPDDTMISKIFKEDIKEGKKGSYDLKEVYFNLRFASIMGMNFKATFLDKVKKVM